ncbi:VOC family protein [Amycolatopsis sp. NBC_01480]|uniref:VOC family protein n=1 Tax=Amycolatopsis sp. NBC_01480 TaxID=2903562 RepID=UPI002E2B076E|nr:VOC family protein [Amycolatopsis sp. NBC_01480]
MLRFGTVVLGVGNMRRALAFWRQALGYVPRDGESGDFVVLVPPGGRAGPGLSLQLSGSPVQELPRVHVDLYADSAAEQAAEVERLVSLGARRVDWAHYPESSDFVVLADTEGNRFCVIDTSLE